MRKHLGKTIFSIGISALLVVYIYVNRESIFGLFTNIKPGFLVLVLIGQIGIIIANTMLLKATLSPLEKDLAFYELFQLTTVSSFVNFFTPVVGGASFKAVYLKKSHKIPYPSFVSIMYANYLMFFLASFILGLFAVLAIPGAAEKHIGQLLILIFIGGVIFSLMFMLFGHKLLRLLAELKIKNKPWNKLIRKFNEVDEGWSIIRNNKKTILLMGLWSVVAILFSTLVIWSAMKSINIEPSLATAVIFAALAIIGLLFNLTPGNLGVRELVYSSIYTVTAIDPKQVVAFSIIDRPAQLLVVGLGWMMFSRSLLKNMSSKP